MEREGARVVALSTAPSVEKGREIARVLVGEGLAACVNVLPIAHSIYRWKGELCDDAEALCVIKTRADRVETLRARLIAIHPYELPELIVLDITGGHPPYLQWIDESSR